MTGSGSRVFRAAQAARCARLLWFSSGLPITGLRTLSGPQTSPDPPRTPRLIADGDTDGHADRFWAVTLAVSAGQLTYQPYNYQPVPTGGGQDFDREIAATGGFRVGKGIF